VREEKKELGPEGVKRRRRKGKKGCACSDAANFHKGEEKLLDSTGRCRRHRETESGFGGRKK